MPDTPDPNGHARLVPVVSRDQLASLIPPSEVRETTDYLLALGITLVRIRGPVPQLPGRDALASAKAPRSRWKDRRNQIRQAFTRNPQPGMYFAGVCGPDSGLVVLDIDLRFHGALDGTWGQFPSGWLAEAASTTLAVRSARGGYHLWFRWPPCAPADWPPNRILYDGPEGRIEFKADGVVVVPPGLVDAEGKVHRYVPFNFPTSGISECPREMLPWIATGTIRSSDPDERHLQELAASAWKPEVLAALRQRDTKPLVELEQDKNTGGVDGEKVCVKTHTNGVLPTLVLSVMQESVCPDGSPTEGPHEDDESKGKEKDYPPRLRPAPGLPQPEADALVQTVISKRWTDDSSRDWAIANALYRRGGEYEQFADAVGHLPREKTIKATSESYIRRTWEAAEAHSDGRLPMPTDDELRRLTEALHDPALACLGPKAIDLLAWLVGEVVERQSWEVIPGTEKLGAAINVSRSGASRYLQLLREEGLVTTRGRGRERALAINLRPLLYPIEVPTTVTTPAVSGSLGRAAHLLNFD